MNKYPLGSKVFFISLDVPLEGTISSIELMGNKVIMYTIVERVNSSVYSISEDKVFDSAEKMIEYYEKTVNDAIERLNRNLIFNKEVLTKRKSDESARSL